LGYVELYPLFFLFIEDWRAEDREEVNRIVRARWTETYLQHSHSVNTQRQQDQPPVTEKVIKSLFHAKNLLTLPFLTQARKWASSYLQPTTPINQHPHDSIEAYLDSPKIPIEEINQVGGLLKYWEQALTLRPGLARMALDFFVSSWYVFVTN
jgi:hypothetical protein